MDEAQSPKATDLEIEGALSLGRLRTLHPEKPVDCLAITGGRFFPAKFAREISKWPAVRAIYLYDTASKAAVRELLNTPGLETLNLNGLQRHGSLKDMPFPPTLKCLTCPFDLSSSDLLEIAKLPNLERLSIHNSHLTKEVVAHIANMTSLVHLDVEASNLDDSMAEILAGSNTIEELYVGATRLRANGVRRICQMAGLKGLDIWALDIQEADLDHLTSLGKLNYLSLGGYEGQPVLTAQAVLPRLFAVSSLKRVWLDGIAVNDREAAEVRTRFEHVQIT